MLPLGDPKHQTELEVTALGDQLAGERMSSVSFLGLLWPFVLPEQSFHDGEAILIFRGRSGNQNLRAGSPSLPAALTALMSLRFLVNTWIWKQLEESTHGLEVVQDCQAIRHTWNVRRLNQGLVNYSPQAKAALGLFLYSQQAKCHFYIFEKL